MLTKRVRVQVGVFVLIALLGISYVGARYAGLDAVFGGGVGYVAKVRLPDSGGIFAGAEVTYRGVTIGRVGPLRLIDDGVEVDLRIDADAPPVPSDVEAVVTNRSAVGEQFVDLRPRRDGEPYLTDGSVIERYATALPLATETLLVNLDKLVASVPVEDLRTVVDEMHLATLGTGPDLRALLDSSASLTAAAVDHLPQTTRLITDSGTVLATQAASSEQIRRFSENAKLIARTLAASDTDIRTLLSTAPAAAREVSALITDVGPGLGPLFANLLTTSTVLATHIGGVEQLLVLAPAVVDVGHRAITEDGAAFGLTTTFFDPMPCAYPSTRYRDGLDTSPAPFNTQARCVATGR